MSIIAAIILAQLASGPRPVKPDPTVSPNTVPASTEWVEVALL